MASKSVKGKSGDGESSSSVPYCVMVRRERSRKLAQSRRTAYKTIMDDLTQVLPFPSDVVSQLDYNSRLRLALCFFKLKNLIDHSENIKQQSQETSQLYTAASSEQESKLVRPGMIQDLMTEALDGFLLVTLVDGTIVYLSESIHKHLGLFQSEHIGVSVYELILEEDHLAVRESVSKAEANALARTSSKGAAEVSFFCRMKCSRFKVANTVTKNPGYKLVYVSGNLKVSGSDPFMVVMVRPVSPPSILEIRMEGNMFVTHYLMDMKCTFFDGRLNHLLGYSKPDLVGNVPFHLHHHDDEDATMQCSVGVMTRGEGLSGYYRFLTKYGTYLWLQTRATVMHDSRSGKPSYIVCMNFVINKEDGEKDLSSRQAIKAAGESSIRHEDTRSHDPFPLVTREDGKVVNPFEESSSTQPQVKAEPLSPDVQEQSTAMKPEPPIQFVDHSTSVSTSPNSSATPDSQVQDAPLQASKTTSLSSSSLSSGQYPATSSSSTSAEEPCLPDSTTSTQFQSESGSLDAGYHTDVSTKRTRNTSEVGSSVFSPSSSVVRSEVSGSVCHSSNSVSPKPNVSPNGSTPSLSESSASDERNQISAATNSYHPSIHPPMQAQEQIVHDTKQSNTNGDNQHQHMPYQYSSGIEQQHHMLLDQQAQQSSQHIQFQQPYNGSTAQMLPNWEPQGFVKNETLGVNFGMNSGSSAPAQGNHINTQTWGHSMNEPPPHLPQNLHFQQPQPHTFQQQPDIQAFAFQPGNTPFPMLPESAPSLPQLTSDDLKVLDYIEQMDSSQNISNVSELVNRAGHH